MISKKKTVASKLRKKSAVEPTTKPKGIAELLPSEQEKAQMSSTEIPDLENPIYKRSSQLIIVTLVLGWLFDYLFWKQGFGINFPIFMATCVLGGGFWLISSGLKPARNSLWLLFPFLFFSVFTFYRQEPLTMFLAITFTLFCLGVFASSFAGGHWILYGFGNYIYKFFLLLGDLVTGFIIYLPKARRADAESASGQGGIPIWGLLRGLAMTLPIVLCFGSLLAAGDVVFKDRLDQFLDLDDLTENIFRGILIVIYAYLLTGVFLHSALKSKDEKIVAEYKPTIEPFLGFTESAVVLGSVAILFLAFVVIQFQYFFGGETNIGVEGYTYSEYARRGFNELILVAFFSLVLSIVLSSIVRRDDDTQRKAYSFLNITVVALILVILISAYQRISLSIWWHGYSRLRLYPRTFLIWLAVMLVAVVVLEVVKRQRHFTFALVLASIGFSLTISLFNIDDAIIRRNVYRSWHGRNLNVPHLASLSTDAIPALADEFLYGELPTSTKQGVGAIIACYKYYESSPHIKDNDWRSFNYSEWKAQDALEKVRPYLAGYVIRYNKYPVRVKLPDGSTYDCRDYDAANDREN